MGIMSVWEMEALLFCMRAGLPLLFQLLWPLGCSPAVLQSCTCSDDPGALEAEWRWGGVNQRGRKWDIVVRLKPDCYMCWGNAYTGCTQWQKGGTPTTMPEHSNGATNMNRIAQVLFHVVLWYTRVTSVQVQWRCESVNEWLAISSCGLWLTGDQPKVQSGFRMKSAGGGSSSLQTLVDGYISPDHETH